MGKVAFTVTGIMGLFVLGLFLILQPAFEKIENASTAQANEYPRLPMRTFELDSWHVDVFEPVPNMTCIWYRQSLSCAYNGGIQQ